MVLNVLLAAETPNNVVVALIHGGVWRVTPQFGQI